MPKQKRTKCKVVILCGLPGSGKTTYANELVEKYGAIDCSADEFMVNDRGEYEFKPEKLGWVHEQCRRKVRKAMRDGVETIVVSNTNIQAREIKPYRKLAEKYNYEVEEELVGGFDDESVKEYAARCVHSVPIEHIRKMARRLKNRLGVK